MGAFPELDHDRRLRMRQRVLGAVERPRSPSLAEDFAYGVVAGLTAPGALLSWVAARLARGRASFRGAPLVTPR